MTLADVLERTLWGEVEAELLYSYPDAANELDKFEQVFRSLLYLTPVKTRLCIVIKERKEPGELPEVSGRDETAPQTAQDTDDQAREEDDIEYALDFQPWDEWLGMSVASQALQTLSLARVAAHCLYELTFWGFSEAEVVAARKDLLKRIAQLGGEETDKRALLLPLSEALRDVRNDPDDSVDEPTD